MGSNLCRERAAASSDSKSTVDRILGRLSLHLCPTGVSRTSESSSPDKPNVYQIPIWPPPNPPLPPPRTTSPKIIHQVPASASEWTEVSLQVSESPPKKSRPIKVEKPQLQTPTVTIPTPVPPPRKNRQRLRDILASGKRLTAKIHKPSVVESPVVTIQKNHSLVCDPNKLSVQISQRAISTVSLPNYKDLDITVMEKKEQLTHDSKRPTISRNISLPGENGMSLSQATAQRLENYMTRCRSFGSLLPQQILDRLKSARCDSDVESEDSWGGLDDWDLGVIEHDHSPHDGISPVTPSSRLPSKKREENVLFAIGTNEKSLSLTIPSNTKEHETIDPVTKVPDIVFTENNDIVKVTPSHLSPNEFVKSDEDLTPTNDTVPDFPIMPKKFKRTARRESIEDMGDWFLHNGEEHIKKSEVKELISETRLGRRGSDIVVGYDTNCYPFKPPLEKDSPFKSDNFFIAQLMENENLLNLEYKKDMKGIESFGDVEMGEDEAKMSLYTDYFNSMLPDESMHDMNSNVFDSNTKPSETKLSTIKSFEDDRKNYSSIAGDLHDIFPDSHHHSVFDSNSNDKLIDTKIPDKSFRTVKNDEEEAKNSMFASLDEEMNSLIPEKKIENIEKKNKELDSLIKNTTTIEVNVKDDHSSLLKFVAKSKLLEEQLSVDSIEEEISKDNDKHNDMDKRGDKHTDSLKRSPVQKDVV